MDFSLVGLWGQMGAVAKTVVVILLVMSMYAIGIALERFLTFRRALASARSATSPRCSRWSEPRGRLRRGGGAGASGSPTRPSARVHRPGDHRVRRRGRRAGPGGAPIRSSSSCWFTGSAVDGARQEARGGGLQRGLSVLATISSSAPFVGLFGTVFGIITAFQQMADPVEGRRRRLASVSAGIAEALLTTAVGLAVAIVVGLVLQLLRHAAGVSSATCRRHGRRAGRQAARESTRACARRRAGPPRRRDGARRERPRGAAARVARHCAAEPQATPRARTVRADINVTPLVDVVLVLLIIFMVVTPLIASGVRGRPAPHAPPHPQARRRQGHHRLGHRGQASLHGRDRASPTCTSWSQRLIDEKRRTPEKTGLLKADARAPYGAVREVMEALHEGRRRRRHPGHRRDWQKRGARWPWTSAEARKGSRGDINVTPLIDVVLVLLIIFMVLTPSMLKHLDRERPQEGGRDTRSRSADDADRGRVHRQASLTINGEPVAPRQLAESLAERLQVDRQKVVFFKAEDEAPYGEVVRLMDIARGSGAKTLAVVTTD